MDEVVKAEEFYVVTLSNGSCSGKLTTHTGLIAWLDENLPGQCVRATIEWKKKSGGSPAKLEKNTALTKKEVRRQFLEMKKKLKIAG